MGFNHQELVAEGYWMLLDCMKGKAGNLNVSKENLSRSVAKRVTSPTPSSKPWQQNLQAPVAVRITVAGIRSPLRTVRAFEMDA